VYPLKARAPHSAEQFDPGDCRLARAGLSGPGVFATGDTLLQAKYRLVKLEEMLNG